MALTFLRREGRPAALTFRAAAAALAGVAAAAALSNPALARWHASGSGTGTVSTNAGAPKIITLTLAAASGKAVKASGTAGYASPYTSAVTVVLCKVNTWPCPNGRVAATLTATAGSGTPSYSVTSGNLTGSSVVYGQASQSETSGWKDYSAVAGPFTP